MPSWLLDWKLFSETTKFRSCLVNQLKLPVAILAGTRGCIKCFCNIEQRCIIHSVVAVVVQDNWLLGCNAALLGSRSLPGASCVFNAAAIWPCFCRAGSCSAFFRCLFKRIYHRRTLVRRCLQRVCASDGLFPCFLGFSIPPHRWVVELITGVASLPEKRSPPLELQFHVLLSSPLLLSCLSAGFDDGIVPVGNGNRFGRWVRDDVRCVLTFLPLYLFIYARVFGVCVLNSKRAEIHVCFALSELQWSPFVKAMGKPW